MPTINWLPSDFPETKVFASKIVQPEGTHTLGFSMYLAAGNRVTHKTCPRCSSEQGRFMWRTMDQYAFRIVNGKLLPQSWCNECRHSQSKQKRRLAHDKRSGRIRKRK